MLTRENFEDERRNVFGIRAGGHHHPEAILPKVEWYNQRGEWFGDGSLTKAHVEIIIERLPVGAAWIILPEQACIPFEESELLQPGVAQIAHSALVVLKRGEVLAVEMDDYKDELGALSGYRRITRDDVETMLTR